MADQVAIDPLAPEAVAAHLAPIIDRLRLAVARRTMQLSAAAGLIESARLDKVAFQLLLMLMLRLPHRAVTRGARLRATCHAYSEHELRVRPKPSGCG